MCVEEWGLNSSFYTDIDLLAIYTVDSIYHSKVDKISRDVIDNCISFFTYLQRQFFVSLLVKYSIVLYVY